MTNPDVLAYIRSQVALGISRDAIKKALATGGWNDQDMAEAFAVIDGMDKAPAPPPSPPPPAMPQVGSLPPITPAITTPRPLQAPSTRPPTIQQSYTLRPVNSIASMAAAPLPKRHRIWPWMLLLILLIAGAAAALYFFFPSVLTQYLPEFFPAAQTTTDTQNPGLLSPQESVALPEPPPPPPQVSTTTSTTTTTTTTTTKTASSTLP